MNHKSVSQPERRMGGVPDDVPRLFVDEPEDETSAPMTEASSPAGGLPKLTLVHPVDDAADDAVLSEEEALSAIVARAETAQVKAEAADDDWPWLNDRLDSLIAEASEIQDLAVRCGIVTGDRPVESISDPDDDGSQATPFSPRAQLGDDSATQDLILSNPFTDESTDDAAHALDTASAAFAEVLTDTVESETNTKTARELAQGLIVARYEPTEDASSNPTPVELNRPEERIESDEAASCPDEATSYSVEAVLDEQTDLVADQPDFVADQADLIVDQPDLVAEPMSTHRMPERIGHGHLVRPRLSWKPGDPFGSRRGVTGFRWELMLTSACLTAACGIAAVWLLRAILA